MLDDLIMALKIIPVSPQQSSSGNDIVDGSVLGNNPQEENKENNPLVTTAVSGNQIKNSSEIVTSTELHSDASNSSSHETENIADNSGGSPADHSHCVKSDSGGTPMEGVEEGTCNGDEIGSLDNAKNDMTNENNLANSTRMSTNSQVDMNMSDTEFSEKD